ncbi:MAG: hypothetical protein SGPRY_006217, partial [Prymnesium sp.]
AEELERTRRREQLGVVSGRAELLGVDRYGRRHWVFQTGSAETNVWVQPRTEDVRAVMTITPPDADGPDSWQYFAGDEACLALAASLDSRGMRELSLQSALRAYVQSALSRKRLAAAEAAEDASIGDAMQDDDSAEDMDFVMQ